MLTRNRKKVKVKNVKNKRNKEVFNNRFHYTFRLQNKTHTMCIASSDTCRWGFRILDCECEKYDKLQTCAYFSTKAVYLSPEVELFGCACGSNAFDLLDDILNFED